MKKRKTWQPKFRKTKNSFSNKNPKKSPFDKKRKKLEPKLNELTCSFAAKNCENGKFNLKASNSKRSLLISFQLSLQTQGMDLTDAS